VHTQWAYIHTARLSEAVNTDLVTILYVIILAITGRDEETADGI